MKTIHLRVITFDTHCSARIKVAFSELLARFQCVNIRFSDLEPYYKFDGYGELNIDFSVDDEQIEHIKVLLSNHWEMEVTDSRWATIFCEDISFIWFDDLTEYVNYNPITHH